MLASKDVFIFIDATVPISFAVKVSAASFIAALGFACMFLMRSSYGRREIIIARVRLPLILLTVFGLCVIAIILPYDFAIYLLMASFITESAILIY
ncbi:hypothetical protein, partial [Enterococcus faecium]|uniref:hypothetical protein n=1 Tax=Enterococcus faecium TaxID=1352 RepID=UPI0034E9460C